MSALEKEAEGPSAAPAAAAEKGAASPGRATLGVDGADGLSGDGLPYKQKSLFQSSLGTDLSNVRVHTGPDAAKQADAVGARAFARGSDIMFAEGQYKPGTPEGDQLLAHEVAHTVQQRDGNVAAGSLKKTSPGDSAERGADKAASAMVDGAPASVQAEPVSVALKGANEEVAPAEAPDGPAGEAPIGAEAKEEGEGKEKEGEEEIGELSVERVGAEQDEGEDQPVGEPQNLEATKQFLAAKGGEKAEGEGGEAEGGNEAPAPQAAPPAGDDGGEIPPEMAAHLAEVQADVQAATEQAQADADAFKAESRARQDRFDNEQNAVAMERLQSMTAAEKRSTLIEMGADEKTVKKMKDAELDGIITGKLETEQRRTKILGMDEKELAALSPAAKQQFLVDLGVEKKDLDKIGPAKSAKAFDDVMRVAHVPGKHKVKVKIKGGLLAKSWEISVNVDADGNPEFDAKKKGGFLSKLWGWVKLALPIIAIVLAPVTGGISLLLLSVYQTVTAIAQGDWLGAIIGAAGAIAGLGAIKAAGAIAQGAAQGAVQGAAGAAQGAAMGAAKFAASGLGKISSVALKVQKAAQAAKATMAAAKAKSPGSLLSALADGASTFAGFSADKAGAFAKKMTDWSKRLEKWSNVVAGGEKVIAGVKNKDPGAALSGAFDAASAYVSKPNGEGEETSAKAKDFQRYSRMASYASAGQSAAKGKPPNYGGVVDAAMGLATELKTKGGKTPKALEDANRIVSSAARLSSAIQSNNPEAMAEAALGLAQTIQTAKYDDPDPNPNAKDTDGDGISDDREKVLKRYSTAQSIVKFAGSTMDALNAKPRVNYTAALAAGTQLIADLTENKRTDQAAVITKRLDGLTAAILSKNQEAIVQAAYSFGESINDMRTLIEQEREDAKKAAQAKMAPGESLPEEGGGIPTLDVKVGLPEGAQIGESVELGAPPAPELTATVTTSEEFKGLVPNYSIVPGDTLGGIAQRFDTSVAELMQANPGINPNRLQIGQRIYVPGADKPLTPKVTTSTEFRLPGADKDEDTSTTPGTGTTPGRGTTPTGPTTDPNKPKDLVYPTTLTPAQQMGLDKLRAVLSILNTKEFNYPAFAAFNGFVTNAVEMGLRLTQTQNVPGETLRDFNQAIDTLTSGVEFWKAAREQFGAFDPDLSTSSVQHLGRFQKFCGRIARAATIPGDTLELVSLAVQVAGFKGDFSGDRITTRERLAAASALAQAGSAWVMDLVWVKGALRAIWNNVTPYEAAKSAKEIVWNATLKYGSKAASVVTNQMDEIFQQMMTTRAGTFVDMGADLSQKIIDVSRIAQREIGRWGRVLEGEAVEKVLLKTAIKGLTGALGIALKTALSGPWQIAYEWVKLEIWMAEELYKQAMDGFSQWLTPMLFGKNINDLKRDIRNKDISSMDACNAFIDYVYYNMLSNARSDVKQGWPQYIYQNSSRFMAGGTFANQFSRGPYQAFKALDFLDIKTGVMHALKNVAIEYIDREYRREFVERQAG